MDISNLQKTFIVILSILSHNAFAGGCHGHSWGSPYPMNADFTEIYNNPLDYNSFFYVSKTHKAEAIKSLENDGFVKIPFKKANAMVGNTIWTSKNKNLYLLRGLSANLNGDTKLYYKNRILLVVHFSMGAPDLVIESPIIAPLPSEPRLVYVWCAGVL